MLRDQSEDRGPITHIVAYMGGEAIRHFRERPWKVFDLRINPTMRGLKGRHSFKDGEVAVAFAVKQESQTTKEA